MAAERQTAGLEQELASERAKLRACERRLDRAQSSVYARDFELDAMRKELEREEQLLDGWRATAREQERELTEAEGKLVEAELRAERLEDALIAIRSGRAYKLMRIVWRLRRPFVKRK